MIRLVNQLSVLDCQFEQGLLVKLMILVKRVSLLKQCTAVVLINPLKVVNQMSIMIIVIVAISNEKGSAGADLFWQISK